MLGLGFTVPSFAQTTQCSSFLPVSLKNTTGEKDNPFVINLANTPKYQGSPSNASCRFTLSGYSKHTQGIYVQITVPEITPKAEALIVESQDHYSLGNGGGIYARLSQNESLSDYPTPDDAVTADSCKSKSIGLFTACQIVKNTPENKVKTVQNGTYLVLIKPSVKTIVDGIDLEVILNKFISDSKKQSETPFGN
ncbi:hypothetical protein JQC92_15200 [Shewanella sp. 202IG2-18]|uniref:hypothetical protein n=1 Tax=Parashewanella hymeniacidonis TaxID=2807618 RepID=UPI001960C06C|nr:hypothetical protein [Parashewanella hymeniacidonis]MBM7073361.1 hypothetical protein [Parashewanella hymeniacidonis]